MLGRKCVVVGGGFLIAGLMPAVAPASIVLTVRAVIAPNATGSPSYATWFNNLVTAYETGATAAGTPNTPTYAEFPTYVTDADFVVSGFASWRGIADPAAAFGAAFASELGNRVHFSYMLYDDAGGQVDVANGITSNWHGSADEPFDPFSSTVTTYRADRIGILKGADNTLFTDDDVILTSGSGAADVIISSGVGNAYPAFGGGTDQQQLDNITDYIHLFTSYYQRADVTYLGTTTNASIIVLPEPAAIGMLGVASLALLRRRKNSRA